MIHPDSLIWIKPRHGSHAKEGTLGPFHRPPVVGFCRRRVGNVPGILTKSNEQARGTPLAASR